MSKEYKIKTKMEQEQWLQLKIMFLLGYNLKIVIWWGDWYLVRRRSLLGGIFLGGGSKFSNGGKKSFAWEVKLFLFSRIPNIFAGNILLKTGKILSLIAFSKLFLNHIKVLIWEIPSIFWWLFGVCPSFDWHPQFSVNERG